MTRFNFTIQDTSPFIDYTGPWHPKTPKNDPDGSFTVTKEGSAKATFDFIGTGVSIFGRDNHDHHSVKLDRSGNPSRHHGRGLDQFQVPLWTSYGLPHGKYTVEVTNEPIDKRPFFDVDFISIEREIGEDGVIFNSTIDDTATNVKYNGAWVMDTTPENQNHNDTLHTTTAPDSEVEITFQGSSIEVYGLYTNAAYNVRLDKKPPRNMHGLDVDLPRPAWQPKTLLYLIDGLSEDTHTVSLTATKTSEMRPFSFDYAVARSTYNTTGTQEYASKHSGKSGLSRDARIGLAVAFSIVGIVLFGLIIAVFLIRRRRRRSRPRIDLTAATAKLKLQPYEIVNDPPWMSLGRRQIPGPRSDTTFQFSSVISWRGATSDFDGWTETDMRHASTQLGGSSVTQSSQRGSIPPVSPPRTVTRTRKNDVMRGHATTSRARESTQTSMGTSGIRAVMGSPQQQVAFPT